MTDPAPAQQGTTTGAGDNPRYNRNPPQRQPDMAFPALSVTITRRAEQRNMFTTINIGEQGTTEVDLDGNVVPPAASLNTVGDAMTNSAASSNGHTMYSLRPAPPIIPATAGTMMKPGKPKIPDYIQCFCEITLTAWFIASLAMVTIGGLYVKPKSCTAAPDLGIITLTLGIFSLIYSIMITMAYSEFLLEDGGGGGGGGETQLKKSGSCVYDNLTPGIIIGVTIFCIIHASHLGIFIYDCVLTLRIWFGTGHEPNTCNPILFYFSLFYVWGSILTTGLLLICSIIKCCCYGCGCVRTNSRTRS